MCPPVAFAGDLHPTTSPRHVRHEREVRVERVRVERITRSPGRQLNITRQNLPDLI